MRPSYKDEIGEIPENVVLRGRLNTDEMKTFYENARMLVHTSICYEGFPMVFPEAMAYKLPIIAPNLAGYPEIVEDDFNGFLFEPENGEDLAKKIDTIWNNQNELMRLGNNGFKKVTQKYSKQFYYISLINAYQNILPQL